MNPVRIDPSAAIEIIEDIEVHAAHVRGVARYRAKRIETLCAELRTLLAPRKRLDLEALTVETFEVPGYGKCACCGDPAALDADGYCDLCGPVEAVFDYGSADCDA